MRGIHHFADDGQARADGALAGFWNSDVGEDIRLVGVDEYKEADCDDDRGDINCKVDGGDAWQQLHAQPPKGELERAAQARHERGGGGREEGSHESS